MADAATIKIHQKDWFSTRFACYIAAQIKCAEYAKTGSPFKKLTKLMSAEWTFLISGLEAKIVKWIYQSWFDQPFNSQSVLRNAVSKQVFRACLNFYIIARKFWIQATFHSTTFYLEFW